MDPRPSTSMCIQNEQVRLSLLIRQNGIPYADGSDSASGTGFEDEVEESKPMYLTSSPWFYSIYFPSSIPPLEHPLFYYLSSIWGFIVSGFLFCLFLLGLPICLIFYFTFGVLLRFGTKLILSGSIPTLLPISRVFGSTNGRDHHTALVVIQGLCDINKIRRSFMNVINTGKYYKLRKRLINEMGYLCLDNCRVRFSISNHVKYFDNQRGFPAPPMGEGDLIQYLEKQHRAPFEGDGQIPQWQVLVVPNYRQADYRPGVTSPSYALIFRFHNGIMDWSMLRELVTVFLGKTAGQVNSPFKANPERSFWENLKIFIAFIFCGPAAFMRKLFGGQASEMFLPLHRLANGCPTYGITQQIPCSNWETIQERTGTGNHCALASCIRTSVRNVFLSQDLACPDGLNVTRVFGGSSAQLDSVYANYNKNRRILDRLHTCFHAIEKRNVNLAATRLFNKMLILMASTFPLKIAHLLHGIIMRGEVVVHFWPGVDEHVQLFGGDIVTDMCGWSGGHGANSDFTITVSSYSGFMRASVIGNLGELSSGLTGAETVANELEEEYKHLATAVGIREYQFFMA